MVQFFFDNVFEWTECVVIDDKANRVQVFRRKDDFRDIIVPMQPATRMTVGKAFYNMAGAEVELLGYCVHFFLLSEVMHMSATGCRSTLVMLLWDSAVVDNINSLSLRDTSR